MIHESRARNTGPRTSTARRCRSKWQDYSSVVDGLGLGVQSLPDRRLPVDAHEALDVQLLPGLLHSLDPLLQLAARVGLFLGCGTALRNDLPFAVPCERARRQAADGLFLRPATHLRLRSLALRDLGNPLRLPH